MIPFRPPHVLRSADAFNAANSAFADEDYDEALEQFNLAIELGMDTADVHVKRAAHS